MLSFYYVRLEEVIWIGEPFPNPATRLSVAAWVRRSIQDLSFYLQEAYFNAILVDLDRLDRLGPEMLSPAAKAVDLLYHMLIFTFGYDGDFYSYLYRKDLRHWLEKISSMPSTSAAEMPSSTETPEMLVSDDSFVTNRRLFILQQIRGPPSMIAKIGWLQKVKSLGFPWNWARLFKDI